MQYTTRPTSTMIDRNTPVLPTHVDILCGSGLDKAAHPGNRRFRLIVAKHIEQFAAAKTKTEKSKVSKAVLFEVLELGGRFLQRRPIFQEWYVGDTKVGKDKISHCLRRAIKDNNNSRKRVVEPVADTDTDTDAGRDLLATHNTIIQQPKPQQPDNNNNDQKFTLDNSDQPPIIAGVVVGNKRKQGIDPKQQKREHQQELQQRALTSMAPSIDRQQRLLVLSPQQQQQSTIIANNRINIIDAHHPFWSSASYRREEIKPSYPRSARSLQEGQILPSSTILPSLFFSMMNIRLSASRQLALHRQYALLNDILSFPITLPLVD